MIGFGERRIQHVVYMYDSRSWRRGSLSYMAYVGWPTIKTQVRLPEELEGLDGLIMPGR